MSKTLFVKKTSLPKIFPGWWLVVTGAFLNFWGSGYTAYGFSAFFKPLAAELGFNRAVTSAAASISRLEGGFEAPVAGWLTDRFGPRQVMLLGISLFGLGLILMYFVNSLWAFYLVWGVIAGTGSNIGQGIPINTAVSNWFVKKRGLALGLRMMIPGAMALPIITWFIITQGWRMANVFGGMVILLVGLPLIWFCVRDKRPEYYGLLPDGVTVAAEATDTTQMIEKGIKYAAEIAEVEFTLRQAMRTPAYWILALLHTTGIVSITIHLVPLLTDMGLSPTKASAVITLAGFGSMVARFGSGVVADRLRTGHLRFLIGGNLLLYAAGITAFLLNQTIPMAYLLVNIFFFCLGVNMIALSVIAGRYFGRKAIGSIRGSLTMVGMPSGLLTPILFGWAYDATGSYAIALTIMVPLLVLTTVATLLVPPPKPPTQVTDIRKIW